MNILVEVHSRWGEVDYFLCQNCGSDLEARERVITSYQDHGQVCGHALEDTKADYYIFQTKILGAAPVVHLFGEYRPASPL